MLQIFRSFFNSKIGVGFTLGFLALIALAFASADVSSIAGFGGSSSGDTVATVGKERIGSRQVETSISNLLSRMRQNDPTATVASFLAKDGLNELLDYMINRKAAYVFGKKHGMYIGEDLINHELAKIPSIQGPDGKVDPALYRRFLTERGMTDAEFREEVAEDLMARQLVGPASVGTFVPQNVTVRYAGMVTERRKGAILTLPAAVFAPKAPPSEAEVKAWYDSHKGDYSLPERRTIRYVTFGEGVLKNVPAPTDAEIAGRYEADKAKYAPTEKRKLSQMVLPSEASARQVMSEVAAGKSLDAAAGAKGLAVASLGSLGQDEYALQTSRDAATAVFGTAPGKIAGPFKVPLGWVLVRVDALANNPGKTLEQARPELVKELTEAKRRDAIAEFSARIEDELTNGANLPDIAKELGVTLNETPQLVANGGVYDKPGVTAPQELAPVFQAAFAMEGEKQPQLTEVEPGKTFMIYDIGTIAPAAPPPMAQIREQVITDIQLSKGAVAAKVAAEKVKAQIEKGVPVEVALASVGLPLPPVDHVDKARMEVQAQGNKASMPERLIFAMAKGKVRLLAAPRNRGWYVVTVTEVTPGTVTKDDKRLAGLQESLQGAVGGEYADQLAGAMRDEVGASRNEGNVAKLKTRLLGGK